MMKKDLNELLDEWQISDAEEFEEDLDNFGEDEVSSDALDRILSSAMKKAGYRNEGTITMNRTNREIKNEQNTGYGEVSRFRGGAAIAACLAVAVAGILGAKTLFGSRIDTDEDTASNIQITAQLPAQSTLPDDSANAATVVDSADDSKQAQTTTTFKNDVITETSVIPVETSEPDTTGKEDTVQPTGHIDITPEKIFSMSIAELKELSNNEYEIVESKWSPQHLCYGYKFAAFPEYVCAIDAFTDPDEITISNSDHISMPPNWIEVDKGVDLGNGISAGMTYKEIKERCDGDIYMKFPWRWLVCATVNGKECCFEIEELTEEERGILGDRLDSSEEQDATGYPIADASDIDPTTTYALIFNR